MSGSARPPRRRPGGSSASLPPVGTVPVLAVLVCHDGEPWLPDALAALREITPSPRYRLAVDTGSTDRTHELLAAAKSGGLLDGVLVLPAGTGFGAAVQHAVEQAVRRWGDPGRWLWLLHDDCSPEPGSLAAMLAVADASPSAALLGPLCLDWADPRLVVEAGLSTDASGHRQTGLATAGELDPGLLGGDLAQSTEVLAVSSAGSLVRRDVWQALGGYDPALPMLRDDLDFGWRVNRTGHVVLTVPAARIRHARAASRYERPIAALDVGRRAADRAHGLRTFLANCSSWSFAIGVPRLILLCLLRALGFVLVRRTGSARAELYAAGYLASGRAGLMAARRARRAELDAATSAFAVGPAGNVRGLLVSRWTRLRNAVRGGSLYLVRRRVAADAATGRLPDGATSRLAPPAAVVSRPIGPQALPAGVLGRRGRHPPGVVGLRRPARGIAVAVPRSDAPAADRARPSTYPEGVRPSPVPRAGGAVAAGVGTAGRAAGGATAGGTAAGGTAAGGAAGGATAAPELLFVEVGRGRLVRELLLSPPVVLLAGLVAAGLAVHRLALGLDLSGGRLAPLPGLGATWAAYLAEWHPVAGGTASPAPATLAVVGVLGALTYPFGGPAAAVSALLLGSIPLAGLSAYLASRRIRVPRWVRALAAACYALLPVGVQAAVQGRLDGVIAHILLPAVLSGVVGVLSGRSVGCGGRRGWLPSACATALGLAVVSAFAPLLHLIVLAVVLVGFVLVPGPPGQALRRVVALFVVVMLPLGLLLPWPAVVLQHPAVLLHGTGVAAAEPAVSTARLVMLDSGGPGSVGWLGALVAGAAILAVLARPRLAAVPGLAVALIGLTGAVVVNRLMAMPLGGGAPRPGWPGAALLVAACGLLWAGLGTHAAGHPFERPAVGRDTGRAATAIRRVFPVLAGLLVAALAAGALLTTAAAVRPDRPALAGPIQAEVAADRTGVLVVGAPGQPARSAAGRLPAFGDDDLAPVATMPARAARWAAAFGSAQAGTTRSAVLEAAVSGIEFVVLPDRAAADVLTGGAGDLVARAPATTDGRPVVRLLAAPAPVVVLPARAADKARTGGAPPDDYSRLGVVAVPGAPPAVGAEASAGGRGRVLVIAAEEEPGWQATVNGRRAGISRAWGHLVAVVLPAEAAEVRVERSTAVRTVLLLVQLAVALFTAITAVPARD